ncbi:MAG: cytochrome b/b6 domain-containing protein [Phycisphaerales bacterium]|nr:MAG: cytochrome b/b6 domain-containing protein [Phycisphaerales bacterium]
MKYFTIANRAVTRGRRTLSPRLVPALLVLALTVLLPQVLYAVDAENCLMCHRFRGLARVDKEGDYRLFYVDESLFSRGPHARVNCRGCHADIEKIPHDNAEPVDCLRSCHIEEPTREIIFTHAKVRKGLEDSVHALTAENGTEPGNPEDYPRCKDCHDIPLFRPVSIFKQLRAGVSERAISRCTQCHSDENFVRYFYSHVTTRLHKARDPREVVGMCASCHADPAFARRHDLPDVVSSYLETYHGKAVLFGSPLAPDCLDCHASQDSVHEMRAATDPRSSIHPENRPATCNTQDCHKSAGPALASFDVHANRNSRTHALEFAVGAFFVIATLGILLPVLTLNILGLVRELLPSHQAEEEIERLTKIAEKKAARENGILRFTGSLRLQHAFLVVVFVVLCLTGFPMKFPEAPWAPVIYDLFGGIHGAPIVHRIAGVALMIGFAAHILLILVNVWRALKRDRKRGIKAWISAILALPMIPKPCDLKDLVGMAKYVFFLSPERPNYGHFCWKEKLEYLGLFWGIPLITVTGILLWAESISSHILPGWALNVAYLAHTYESLLAVAHIMLVHIPGVIGRPGVSPLSSMVINGKISPRALAEEHGGEVQSLGAVAEVKS